jgi:hypothetical protein
MSNRRARLRSLLKVTHGDSKRIISATFQAGNRAELDSIEVAQPKTGAYLESLIPKKPESR